MSGMDSMGGFGWLGMGLMWLWLLAPAALVVGVGWLLGTAAMHRPGRRSGDDAAALLRRRLAAGEISVEEYENARVALGLSDGSPRGHPLE